MASFPSAKLMPVINSACTVDHAVSICDLFPILVGPPSSKRRKPEVGLRVYTKAVDVASGSLSSCVGSAGSATGFSRGCSSVAVSV